MVVGSAEFGTVEEACEFVSKIWIVPGKTLHHVHLYGAGVRVLESLEEVMADKLHPNEATCIRINCAKFDNVKLMQDEIDALLKECLHPQKMTLVLLRAEEMSRFKIEHLRMLFNRLNKERSTLIVTVSDRPWGKIESQGFRMALSSPLQYHIPQPGVHDEVSTIRELCSAHPEVSPSLIEFVVQAANTHYSDFKSLSYIIDWVAERCRRKEIDPGSTIKPSELSTTISAICKEIKSDAAFSPQPLACHSAEVNLYPLLTKMVIIAAYCASYNPTSSDARYFSKNASNQGRRKRTVVARREREKFHETGPRAFDYKRVVAIYAHFWRTYSQTPQSTLEAAPITSAEIDMAEQLQMLICDGLLAHTSAPDNLETPKFKCLCTLEFVDALCHSIDTKLDIRRDYLLDFVIEE